MDWAALQRVTLERSSAALCWTARGAREQQSLPTWFVRFAVAQRIPNVPTLWVSGVKPGLCLWPYLSLCCNALQVFGRDDDTLEAPEQFCSCPQSISYCSKPHANARFAECFWVWPAVKLALDCSAGLVERCRLRSPLRLDAPCMSPNDKPDGQHLALWPSWVQLQGAPQTWAACYWHLERSERQAPVRLTLTLVVSSHTLAPVRPYAQELLRGFWVVWYSEFILPSSIDDDDSFFARVSFSLRGGIN